MKIVLIIKRTYEEPHGYKENGYVRYYLYQNRKDLIPKPIYMMVAKFDIQIMC